MCQFRGRRGGAVLDAALDAAFFSLLFFLFQAIGEVGGGGGWVELSQVGG